MVGVSTLVRKRVLGLIGVVAFVQRERLPLARKELHALLEDPELQKMPLLVLGNKIDLEPHMSKEEIIKGLNLDYIQDQPWECMAISGLRGMGVERVIDWLIAHARK